MRRANYLHHPSNRRMGGRTTRPYMIKVAAWPASKRCRRRRFAGGGNEFQLSAMGRRHRARRAVEIHVRHDDHPELADRRVFFLSDTVMHFLFLIPISVYLVSRGVRALYRI